MNCDCYLFGCLAIACLSLCFVWVEVGVFTLLDGWLLCVYWYLGCLDLVVYFVSFVDWFRLCWCCLLL